LLQETACVRGEERFPRFHGEEGKLDAMRGAAVAVGALGLGAVDDQVHVCGRVNVGCVAQTIIDWEREMVAVTEDLRMAEGVLEAGRRAGNTDGVFVCGADEDFGEFRVRLRYLQSATKFNGRMEGEEEGIRHTVSALNWSISLWTFSAGRPVTT
jgi:hypothetical protein